MSTWGSPLSVSFHGGGRAFITSHLEPDVIWQGGGETNHVTCILGTFHGCLVSVPVFFWVAASLYNRLSIICRPTAAVQRAAVRMLHSRRHVQHPSPVSPNLGAANLGFSFMDHTARLNIAAFDLISSGGSTQVSFRCGVGGACGGSLMSFFGFSQQHLDCGCQRGNLQQDQGRWPAPSWRAGFPHVQAFSPSSAARNGLKVTSRIWSVRDWTFRHFTGFLEAKRCLCLSSASYGNFCLVYLYLPDRQLLRQTFGKLDSQQLNITPVMWP